MCNETRCFDVQHLRPVNASAACNATLALLPPGNQSALITCLGSALPAHRVRLVFTKTLPQRWTWVIFSSPNPTQRTSFLIQPNPTHHSDTRTQPTHPLTFERTETLVLLENSYTSRASHFRDLSRIAKLNTRAFLELPITISLFALHTRSTLPENLPNYNAANFPHKKIAKLRCRENSVLQ